MVLAGRPSPGGGPPRTSPTIQRAAGGEVVAPWRAPGRAFGQVAGKLAELSALLGEDEVGEDEVGEGTS